MIETSDVLMQEDLEYVANAAFVPWENLKNKSVLVTGATGLIGSQLVKALACRNRMYGDGIKIFAMVRNEEKARKVFSEIIDRDVVNLVFGDINGEYALPQGLNYVIHAASMTSSKDFVEKPVETIQTALFGTDRLLRKSSAMSLDGFLYMSSLEVYGVPEEGLVNIKESYSGYIDQLQVRSSYSEGKRMVECLCSAYASEYKVPVKVVRLTQTFGTGVAYNDGRVFAQFARAAIEGEDIVLKTKGETLRNYCYVADAVTALLTVLVKGNVGEAYNVANENTAINIADMAEFVCKNFSDGKSKVVFDIAEDATKLGYNPVMKACLDPSKLKKLGWNASYNLQDMFKRTIGSMKP